MCVERPQSGGAKRTCNVNGRIQHAHIGSECNLFDSQITRQTRQDKAANKVLDV